MNENNHINLVGLLERKYFKKLMQEIGKMTLFMCLISMKILIGGGK